jgi:hypothetical protein
VTECEFNLEEYRALRSEIIQSMDDGNQIMSFGLASLGVLFGAAVQMADTWAAFVAFVVCLPMLSALILSYWVAAQERIAKASHYLSGTERRLKKSGGFESAVSWESWLRRRDSTEPRRWSRSWNAEKSGMLLFSSIVIGSVGTGLSTDAPGVSFELKSVVGGVVSIVSIPLMLHAVARYRNCRSWLKNSFSDSYEAKDKA